MNVESRPRVSVQEVHILLLAGALIGTFMITKFVLDLGELSPALRLIRGLLPAAAVASLILAELRIIRRLDERERRIQLEALAFGYPTALLIVVAIRFLQADGFLPGWHLGDVWPFIPFPYFLGLWLARRRYAP